MNDEAQVEQTFSIDPNGKFVLIVEARTPREEMERLQMRVKAFLDDDSLQVLILRGVTLHKIDQPKEE